MTIINLLRCFQNYFQNYHKRGTEDGAPPPNKRPRTANTTDSTQPTIAPVTERREADHPLKPPTAEEEDAPNEEKKEIVTSLFTGNPDIPYIPKSEVTRLSEKVFSEDAFSSLDLASQIVSVCVCVCVCVCVYCRQNKCLTSIDLSIET